MTNREKMNELLKELNAGMGTDYTIDQLNRLGDNEFMNHWLKAEYKEEKDYPMYNQYTGFEGNVTALASKLIGTARTMEIRFQVGGQRKYAVGLTFVRYLLAQYDAEAYANFLD